MPRLSRWAIRASLVYLLLGFTIGGLMLANKGISFYPALWNWLPVHIEFMLFGWVIQLVMGVAFSIAPRFWRPPRRGNETGAYAAVLMLNLGIWCVVIAALGQTAVWRITGRLLEAAAAAAFAWHLWRRIIPRNFPLH